MKKITLYIIVFGALLIQMFCLLKTHKSTESQPHKVVVKAPSLSSPKLPSPSHGVKLKAGNFTQLPGWGRSKMKQSLLAFRISCHAFLKQNPNDSVGSQYIPLKAKDWYPACNASNDVDINSEKALRAFFQTWFTPVEFHQEAPVKGLFTGYYLPLLQGSLKKSKNYSVPIYALPPNLLTANLRDFSHDLPHKRIVGHVVSKKILPFYARADIDKGVLARKTKVLAWVNNALDRLILETEGSGVVALQEGGRLAVGYAGDNGAKYRSVASILIKKGRMSADEASMPHIRKYFKSHPDEFNPVMNQNQSFVFFHPLPKNEVHGSQGVALSAGYSLAVDRKWIPMGVPLWLTTTVNNLKSNTPEAFNRLMIAQDTGGSIRGMVRGDIYMGEGEEATAIATHIRSEGHYWLLLPRVERLT